MTLTTLILMALIVVAAILVLLVMYRPRPALGIGGKALALLGMLAFPLILLWGGANHHLEQSKTTEFCLSCHVMQPYGRSLRIDDPSYLPAAHFQNRRIPREQACYTCHTSYAMFGDIGAKLNGAKHLWIYYLGTVPERIELYQPFQNRECLHCHDGARSFEENELHAAMLAELKSNEASCLDCHSSTHSVHDLESFSYWEEKAR